MYEMISLAMAGLTLHCIRPQGGGADRADCGRRESLETVHEPPVGLMATKVVAVGTCHLRLADKLHSTLQRERRLPRGSPLPDLMRYLTYAEGYRQFALWWEELLKLPPEIRQARSRQCAACTIRCPNGAQGSERLIRAQELFGWQCSSEQLPRPLTATMEAA